MAAHREVTPPRRLDPIDVTEAECDDCGFKVTAMTPAAARDAFRDHDQWHRHQTPSE